MKKVCVYTKNGDIEEILKEISRHEDWIFDMQNDLYTDDGISGTTTKNRGELNTMIERAKAGRYNLVVVREVCSFTRNAKITLGIINELKKCRVEVYFVNDGIWSFNKDDYFRLTIMASYAAQEFRKVSAPVFRSKVMVREIGTYCGDGNKLWYDLVKSKKLQESNYIINEEQAMIALIIFDFVLRGDGIRKIKRYLEDNGYKASSDDIRWYLSITECVLRRIIDMGKFMYFQSVRHGFMEE